jgi:hypothetical protein
VSEQAPVGEQWADPAASERAVSHHAAEGGDVDQTETQTLLGVDRRCHDQRHVFDLLFAEAAAPQVLANHELGMGAHERTCGETDLSSHACAGAFLSCITDKFSNINRSGFGFAHDGLLLTVPAAATSRSICCCSDSRAKLPGGKRLRAYSLARRCNTRLTGVGTPCRRPSSTISPLR